MKNQIKGAFKKEKQSAPLTFIFIQICNWLHNKYPLASPGLQNYIASLKHVSLHYRKKQTCITMALIINREKCLSIIHQYVILGEIIN